MTVKAAKQKGRLGQQEIRDKILETFPEFEPDDVKSTTMGESGADILLSPAARKKIPLSIEVKRRKSGMKMQYDWIAQAKRHNRGEPVLFFRADRSDWIVMIGLDHYMELLKGWKRD
jgi:hypothetical protein